MSDPKIYIPIPNPLYYLRMLFLSKNSRVCINCAHGKPCPVGFHCDSDAWGSYGEYICIRRPETHSCKEFKLGGEK